MSCTKGRHASRYKAVSLYSASASRVLIRASKALLHTPMRA